MKKCFKALSVIAIAAMPLALMGALKVPDLPASKHSAVIYSPGNGDLAGYRIVVEPDGKASAVDGAGRGSGWLQPDVAQRFFTDLAAAGPLAQLSNRTCSAVAPGVEAAMVEVNPAIVLTWNGERSPDLSCATDPRAVKLLLDATTIQHALYVQAYRVRTIIVFGGGYGGGSATGYSQPQSYTASSAPSYGDYGSSGFNNQGFTNSRFTMDHFYNDHFSNGGAFNSGITFRNPYSGNPYSAGPFNSSPYNASPFTEIPFNSAPLRSSP